MGTEPTINLTVAPIKGTGVFTISGTPSVTLNNMTVYTYTINTTGNCITSCAGRLHLLER